MLDFKSWVQRALDFTESLRGRPEVIDTVETQVAPPMTSKAVSKLSKGLRIPIPSTIRHFLVTASANCSCKYVTTEALPYFVKKLHQIFPDNNYIYGGASLCNAAEFSYYQTGCYDWGSSWLEAGQCLQDAELWLRCFPFAHINNGDCLGLDIEADPGNPPVAYLSHDGEGGSCIISRSFEQFLVDWEQLSYVGPEIWLLSLFRDPASGLLNPSKKGEKMSLLRDLFKMQ